MLVCTFAVVLSVCNKAVNSSSNGSGTAFADGSTVTISSQALPSFSAVMTCIETYNQPRFNSGKLYYHNCDSSNVDSSIISSMTVSNSGPSTTIYYAISHDDAFKNGWKLLRTGGLNAFGFVFYK